MSNRRFPLSALAIALCHLPMAKAVNWQPSQSDFGGVGLMQMPTGRFAPEGNFAVGGTFNADYYHYHLSMQLMSWLETTVRYTRIPDLRYSADPGFSGDNAYTDKGLDLKLRLLRESYWLPELAIGLRDIGGTGLFDGEYLAASKRFGPLDFTLGIGWGYLGNSANLSGNKQLNAHCDRDNEFGGNGGLIDFDRWFGGCAALFGGVEYQTPWQPLSLKLEYDGNDYQSDYLTTNNHVITQHSKFNYGLVYQFKNWGELRASYERGDTWTLGFTLKTNFDTLSQPWKDEPAPVYAPDAATGHNEIDWQKTAQQLEKIAGFQQAKIYADDSSVTLIGEQQKYRNREQAHRAAATIIANTGTQAKHYHLVETQSALAISQTNIEAQAFSDFMTQQSVEASFSDAVTLQSPIKSNVAQLKNDATKPWSVGIAPSLRQSLGGSEDFYLFNIGVVGHGHYWLMDKLKLSGDLYLNLYDNYDKFLYETPSDRTDLKRVRTLVRQYISDNRVRVNNLQLTHFNQFGKDIYTQAYAGYLESMFAGVGGEILYRPYQSNWAVGLDLNYVIQRDPDSQFGLFSDELHYYPNGRDTYRVQTGAPTGHITAYYRPEWSYFNNFLVKVSAGQYLTEDIGATVDISKQFKSGVIVGAYAAKTNLSAEEFGEGSFNKGFYLSIPLDVLTVKPSTNRATISWAPLTRDGGQMLRRKYSLYDLTSARYKGSEFSNK